MMTGVTPPGAIERGEYLQQHKRDLLPPPSKYNKAITKAQETALLNGHGPAYAGAHAERG